MSFTMQIDCCIFGVGVRLFGVKLILLGVKLRLSGVEKRVFSGSIEVKMSLLGSRIDFVGSFLTIYSES